MKKLYYDKILHKQKNNSIILITYYNMKTKLKMKTQLL